MIDYRAEENLFSEFTPEFLRIQSVGSASDSRRSFDPTLASRRAKAQAEFDAEMNKAKQRLVESFGHKLEAGLRISKEGRINIKGPEGQSRMYEAVIVQILSVNGASQTQSAIRQKVQLQMPDASVPKDWTKPLPTWSIRNLKRDLSGWRYGIEFVNLKINPGTSLSDLHRAAKAHLQRVKQGAISFKVEIVISDDAISIDGLSSKISSTKAGGKIYRYARINADELATHFR